MSEIPVDTSTRLTGPISWNSWYIKLQSRAKSAGIWGFVDPDGDREPDLEDPQRPTREQARDNLILASQEQLPEGLSPSTSADLMPSDAAVMAEFARLQDSFYKDIAHAADVRKRMGQLQRWLAHTVDPKLYKAAKARRKKDVNLIRGIIQALRSMLTLSVGTLHTMVAAQYMASLDAAKRSGVNPQRWIRDFNVAFKRASEHNILEVQGARGIYAFLDAIAVRIQPTWAANERLEIQLADGMGQPLPELSTLVRMAEILINNDAQRGVSRKQGIFLTHK
ncbi:hypothetical protein L209DRAFT_757964 [Thermothelomyces heterothallicus CBS 203.75]